MAEDKELKEKILKNKKSGWESASEEEKGKIFEFCDSYINFLNLVKTEREAVEYCKQLVEIHGFKDINTMDILKPGDKVYK